MQLALPQLQAHLQKGLRSLYTLHGDEALLVQEAADARLYRTQRACGVGRSL
jgi:DNA polymerase-3 subunit delta